MRDTFISLEVTGDPVDSQRSVLNDEALDEKFLERNPLEIERYARVCVCVRMYRICNSFAVTEVTWRRDARENSF